MKAFIIEADLMYLTDADADIGEAKWTDEIDLATPFKTEARARRAIAKWDDYHGVDLICRIVRHDFL